MDTWIDDNGVERCGDCDEELAYCGCECDVTGENVHECAGPDCEHEGS